MKTISYVFLLVLLVSAVPAAGCGTANAVNDSVAQAVQIQLNKVKNDLYFPQTVKRFYQKNGDRLMWVLPDSVKGSGWEAMLLIDCVMQFGLNHDDYHPGNLLSIEMHRLRSNYNSSSLKDKVAFDLFLTDAMVALLNHLHYGKLNPSFSAHKIDAEYFNGFHADSALLIAIKADDFMTAILNVQPQDEVYRLLQSRMRLLTGQYVGDCYEAPQGEVRKIAVNLERLRWLDKKVGDYIRINIPSRILTVKLRDSVYQFKVILGSAGHLTQGMENQRSRFTLFPEKKASGLVLHFPKKTGYEAITIAGDEGKKLAKLLLISKHLPVQFTYLTCADINGFLVTYQDLYGLDKNIESGLYASRSQ